MYEEKKMPYVETFERNQMMMCSWDELVARDSIARLIDAFVDSLDLSKYGVREAAHEGRPMFDPKGMYKLFIYGNRKGIRSSRKLADACKVNVEVKWMVGGVEPDFRTISEFRKANIDSMKEIFHEFNRRIARELEWDFLSVDGSKFRANNSKDKNFTKSKIDDRITWLNARTDEYLRILTDIDESDEGEEDTLTRESIEAKLKEARERLERYEGYQKMMEDEGLSQLSLTDAEARLMKSKNGYTVSYNPQTAVDSNTHIIRNFEMTNNMTDHGMIAPTVKELREEKSEGIIEVVADKGYNEQEDMVNCLESGIIPHVITEDNKDGYTLEVDYEEADEVDRKSERPEEIKRCLRAGEVPEAYKSVISDVEIKEVRREVDCEEDDEIESPYETAEEMQERAKEGYFVRDPKRKLVYCPKGEILRQKSIKKNGNIRYANKNACKHCKDRNKCYKGQNQYKEVDFTPNCLEKPCKSWLDAEGKEADAPKKVERKTKKKKVKVVRFFFRPNRTKTAERLCISEHPFGTLKRAMGADYFLLRGKRKVSGEFALFCLGYNMERAKNLLGFDKMMQLMVTE